MSTDRHKPNRQVVHLSDKAHEGARVLRLRTGKTLGTIVEELIVDEVATNGRRKELRDRALAMKVRR